MAEPILPPRTKLFIGILTTSEEFLSPAEKALEKKFGEIDFRTMKIPFTNTDYYSAIGKNLFRTFLSFRKLIKREDIAGIKLNSKRLEKKISGKEKRRITSIGYLTLSNVYLASCKEFSPGISLKAYLENEYRYVQNGISHGNGRIQTTACRNIMIFFTTCGRYTPGS